MSDELSVALEAMIDAARTHLDRVRAADGRIDDESVWNAYVDLNNAACAYDESLRTSFDEVTPFDVEPLEVSETDAHFHDAHAGGETVEPDAEPTLVTVRQRRDYLVPSLSALVASAERAREQVPDPEGDDQPLRGIGDAVLELLHAGDGSLRSLDVPELTPLDGIVAVNDIHVGLDVSGTADGAENAAFTIAADGPVIGRIDERSFHTGDRNADFSDDDRDK